MTATSYDKLVSYLAFQTKSKGSLRIKRPKEQFFPGQEVIQLPHYIFNIFLYIFAITKQGTNIQVTVFLEDRSQVDIRISNINEPQQKYIGVGRGGPAPFPRPPPNNLRGEGRQHTLWPPNSPSTFSFTFYVKQEKMTNVPS